MNDYLKHYGILGMKWGVRRYQNKDGSLTPEGKLRYHLTGYYRPVGRTMITRKRQLAADKSDLEKLNSGKHLSVGFTKKRQDAYDKRDKAALERRIKYNEEKLKFREDVKAFKKNKLKYDTKYDKNLGTHVITQWYDSRGAKVGRDYIEKVMKQATKEKTYASLAGTAAVLAGASLVGSLLGKSGR